MLEFRIAGLLNLLFFAFRNFNKQAAITDKTQDTHTAIQCAFIILTLRLTFSYVFPIRLEKLFDIYWPLDAILAPAGGGNMRVIFQGRALNCQHPHTG